MQYANLGKTGWILSKPYIASPIIGATQLNHLDQAVAALDLQFRGISNDWKRRTSRTPSWSMPKLYGQRMHCPGITR